eukprot:600997-Rhodomonas_salina.3
MARSAGVSSLLFDIVHREPTPDLSPPGPGPFVSRVAVTVSHSAGSRAVCTTDGSDPTDASPLCAEPVIITAVGTTVVKAMASARGRADSHVTTREYHVLAQVRPPEISPRDGLFTTEVVVRLYCPTPGSRIRYTTDGSRPTAASAEYEEAIGVVLRAGEKREEYVVRAMGVKAPDMGDSNVVASGQAKIKHKNHLYRTKCTEIVVSFSGCIARPELSGWLASPWLAL